MKTKIEFPFFAVLTLAGLVGWSSRAYAADANALLNGDFEGGFGTPTAGVANSWSTANGGTGWAWAQDTVNKHSGTSGQKISKSSATTANWGAVRQTLSADIGDAFTLADAWVYSTLGSAEVAVTVRVYWDGSTTYANAPVLETAAQGANAWYQFTTKPAGNATATTVPFIFRCQALGTTRNVAVTWDDLVIYHAYVPAAPTVNNATASTLAVTVNKNANDAEVHANEYAITVSGGAYVEGTDWVQSDGTVGATKAWRTRAVWDLNKTVIGLAPTTTYTFKVVSRYNSTYPQQTILANSAGGSETTLAAGGATRLVITGSPTQTAGSSQDLTITAKDDGGATITSYTGSKNLTFSGANSSPNSTAPTVKDSSGTAIAFGSATAITFSSGVATVSGGNNGVMTLYKAESATISVSDGTIVSPVADRLSVTVNAAAGNAANSTVSASPTAVQANGTAASTITVTLLDAYNNPVSGKTVTLASSRGATDTISAASGPSSASGVVTFTVTSTTPGSPVFTATDDTDSVVITQTATVLFPKNLFWGSGANWTDTDAWWDTDLSAVGTFANFDYVTLEDTKSGSSAVVITLTSTVQPGGITVSASKDFEISGSGGVISGTTTVNKTGSGTLTLGNNDHTYSGGLTVSAGTLVVPVINNSSAAGPLGQGSVTIGAGTLKYTGTTASSSRAITLVNGATTTIEIGSGATLTLSTAPSISGGTSSGLTKTGTGALTLAAANNTLGTGALTISNGTMTFSASPSITCGSISVATGATLDTAATAVNCSGAVTLDGTLKVNGGNTISGNITVNSGGDLINNFHSSGFGATATIIVNSGGQLELQFDGLANQTITRPLQLNGTGNSGGGALQWNDNPAQSGTTGKSMTWSGGITLNGSSKIVNNLTDHTDPAWNLILSGGISLGGNTLTLVGGTITINTTAISGSGALVFTPSSSRTHALSATASSATSVTVNGVGTLQLGAANLINDAASVVLTSGTFDLNTFSETIGTLSGGGSIINNSGTLTINAPSGEAFSGSISGSGGIVKNAGNWEMSGSSGFTGSTVLNTSGTLTLSGTLTATTQVNINGGTLVLGSSDRINNAAAVTVGGGILSLGTANDTVGAVMLTSGSITGSGGILTGSSYAVQSGSVSAVLAGSGINLTKTTTGTVTLSAANTYSGNTTISGGKLALDSSASINNSPVILVGGGATFDVAAVSGGYVLASGQILRGNGNINGAVTVTSGAQIAPGSSIGTLTLNSDLLLNGGSATGVEVDRGGPSSDLITGIGTFTQGGTLYVTNNGATLQSGDQFTLFSASTYSGEFAAISPANPNSDTELAWDAPALKNTGVLKVHHVPYATNVAVYRGSGLAAKVKLSDLFPATDPVDSDAVVLESFTAGEQNATITSNATYIFYTPANGNNDTFNYTVKDNRGGSRTRTVTVVVTNGVGGVTITNSGGGTISLTFYGIPGYEYRIQRSCGNLNSFADWGDPITAPNSGLNIGLIQTNDTPGICNPAYYRVRQN